MNVVAFLVWSLVFWPMIGLTEYVIVKGLGHNKFFLDGGAFIFVLVVVWIVGMFSTYELIKKNEVDNNADQEEEGEVEPNALLIVEATRDNKRFGEADDDYIESKVYFEDLPAKGKRLVLNAEKDDDSNILGTVVEAAEGAHLFGDGTMYRVWIKLDKEEDYSQLSGRIGWYGGSGEKRRSTSPHLDQTVRQGSF